MSPQLNLVDSYRTSCSTYSYVYCNPSCTGVIYQLSSLTTIYFIMGFKSFSPTFLVEILYQLQTSFTPVNLLQFIFSPFLTKCTLLEMCLVCLVVLPLLVIHTEDLLSNIIRGDASGTIYVSLFNNSWINILKCDKKIPAIHAALYSLYVLDW